MCTLKSGAKSCHFPHFLMAFFDKKIEDCWQLLKLKIRQLVVDYLAILWNLGEAQSAGAVGLWCC
jgi:hypothetical protein